MNQDTLFTHSPTGLAVLRDSRICQANHFILSLLGYSADDLQGGCGFLFENEKEFNRVITALESSPQHPPLILETRMRRKDGNVLDIRLHARRHPDPRTPGTLVAFQDISELRNSVRELESQARALDQGLAKRTRELQTTVAELARRNWESSLLSSLGDLLQTSDHEERCVQVLSSACSELFPADSGHFALLDENGQGIEITGRHGTVFAKLPDCAEDNCRIMRGDKTSVFIPGNDTSCPCLRDHDAPHICVAVEANNTVMGALLLQLGLPGNMSGYEIRNAVEGKMNLFKRVTEVFSVNLANLRLRERLWKESITDRLTGLYNRRHMEASLRRELERAKRTGTNLGLVLMDVDHFKRFNDTHGHEAGDLVLKELGAFLCSSIRAGDIPCRFGGEELLIILPASDLVDSYKQAERIRKGVENLAIRHSENSLRVTVSVGVSSFPDNGDTTEALINAADSALYKAKRAGRDTVVAAC